MKDVIRSTSMPVAIPRAAWLLLAALFLVPRVALIVVQNDRMLRGDELSYEQIARNVSSGRGFASGQDEEVRTPTAARGPSYVLLVAAFDAIFGRDRTPLYVFQVLLDALTLLLLARITHRWFGSWWIAWIAGVLYASYPPIVTATASVLTETLTQLMILLWVTWFFAYLDRRRSRDLMLAAIALAICAMSKPHLALFAPVTCLAAVPRLGWASGIRSFLFVVLVTTLTMSPWIARNLIVFHEFVPGVSIGGMGILFGSGAFNGKTVGSLQHPAVPDSIRAKVGAMTELEANRWATREAMRVVRENPARYARLSIFKAARLWVNLGFDEGRPSKASLVVAAFNLALIVLAFIGSGIARDNVAVRLLAFGAIYWTLVHVPFFANVRYVVPFLVLVFAFSGAGFVRVVQGFRGKPAV